MVNLKEFRKANGLKQEDLVDFFGVAKSFISQVENGKSKLPDGKLNELLNNKKGWDVSMLQDNPSISANASHNSKASISIHAPREDNGAVIAALKKELEILREQLAEEKKRSAQYWDMIQRLTK